MEAIVNNLIKAIGWSIFHSLWQAAIIYGILLAVVSLFPNLTARFKHNLAYGAMCLMFAGFCITFCTVFKWPADKQPVLVGNAPQGINAAQEMTGFPATLSTQAEQLFPYITAIYSLGILFQLLILTAGYKKLQALKGSDKNQVPSSWQQIFQEMTVKLGIRRPVDFYLSGQVNIPLVIGYFKPVVLFPVALVAQLDIRQVEAILIHELSHIRRNDYLLNLIKTAIETLMFFNPFIWLSNRFVNIEREHACDDLVLKLTGTPLTYAHALLKLEILKDKATPALSMAASGKQQHLYQRIKRITDMKTNYMNAKQQLFAITLTVATVISLAWIGPAKTEPAILKPGVTHKQPALKQEAKNPFKTTRLKQEVKPAAEEVMQDTTKKRRKFRIVTIDPQGNKKEYDSMKEMPDSLRKEVVKETFSDMGNFHLNYNFKTGLDTIISKKMFFMKSPEWQEGIKAMSEDLAKKFSSDEWKKQQELIRKQTAEIHKYFNSEDWKKQQKELTEQSKKARHYFSSPEWKKNQKKMAEDAKKFQADSKLFQNAYSAQIKDAQKIANSIHVYLSSPELKKKLEEARALENSAEYKELKKKFEAEVEALKKKKAGQPDNTPF
ncbi:M56 family metallopeptidase [Pedobacter africanus]|uniref:Signal transducer regulating beta-lactamase production, contains metallopeptidase domain n=1 Tax=Pedobacter africanus TaxID=151894 RepID=A0A1W2EFY1_9SPHI|nr:M56 family metallopeptidase [Pedobacter africanus]SMD08664.1 Signal transducer regulating beta-lactamase production, contains metallopeptidase domain [Pedobacter africanus]